MGRDLRKLGGGILAGLLLNFPVRNLIGVSTCPGAQKDASSSLPVARPFLAAALSQY